MNIDLLAKKGWMKDMKKRILSFILMLAMAIAVLSPISTQEAKAQEIYISNWAISDLIFGDTYGIYPLSWYEQDLTKNIRKDQLRVLLYGVRRKIVETNCATEVRTEKPVIDDKLTVQEVIEAFYTTLSNFDYTADMGLGYGLDAVSYMTQLGVYTGAGGEQGLQDLCSVEQAMVIATRLITIYYELLGASSKGFLWQIKSGGNTVYLLGSIHLANTDLYPLSMNIWNAYFVSDALVVEANMYDADDLLALQTMMFYSDGSSLKDHLSAETYQKVVEIGAMIGYPEEMVAMFKPWAIYSILNNYSILNTSTGDNTTAQLGVDAYLMLNAYIYQKPILPVEGFQKQAEIFESFSPELMEYLINSGCDLLKGMLTGENKAATSKMNTYLKTLYKSWKDGDVEAFSRISAGSSSSELGNFPEEYKALAEEYDQKFMTQRDDGMAQYIEQLLKAEGNNTYFVVLGAMHYISDYDVIDRLEQAGYVVEQIK